MTTIKIKNARLSVVNVPTIFDTFDVNDVQQVRYNANGTYIYEGSTDSSVGISYILPVRIKPNTRLTIKTKNNTSNDIDGNITGAIHYLGDVNPSTLTPRTILKSDCILDGDSLKYDNFYNDAEATFVIPSGCHAVELYMFEFRSKKTPSAHISAILDKVSVVIDE